MVTVFTPTYNRVHLLDRLYHSLTKQSCMDFEWLIVDDGSTDTTQQYIEEIKQEGRIQIHYYRQENGGKHLAHNTAVMLAKGEWFFCVDSDDWLKENAIEEIERNIELAIETDCALIGYKVLENGKLLSKTFSLAMSHKGFYQMGRMGAGGEYSIVLRTSVIRKYLFPVIAGERFSTEAILYDRLELNRWTMYPVPVVLTICEYQEDGLTSQIYSLMLRNPVGYQIFHMQRIDLVKTWKERIRHAIQYEAFRCISHNMDYCYNGKYKWLVMLAHIPGVIGAQYYKKKRSS